MPKKKAPFSKEKAKKILREKSPTLRGKPVTGKQRRLLGFIAGGGKPTRLKKAKGKRDGTGKRSW
jgi:hypothetical protein